MTPHIDQLEAHIRYHRKLARRTQRFVSLSCFVIGLNLAMYGAAFTRDDPWMVAVSIAGLVLALGIFGWNLYLLGGMRQYEKFLQHTLDREKAELNPPSE